MKKTIIIISVIIVIALGAFAFMNVSAQRNAAAVLENLETEPVQRGALSSVIGATGSVRSNQSAYLLWKVSGQVDNSLVNVGDTVAAGDTLAIISETTLPSYIILAQADLVNTQRELETLLTSSVQQAEALAAVEEAEKELEDALNPQLAQAQAHIVIAKAEADLDAAETQLAILTKSVTQAAVDQAFANMILAEKKLNDLKDNIAKFERKKNGPKDFWESKKLYKRIIESLEMQLPQLQIAYDNSAQRYKNLLAPPDPLDVMVAEAAVFAAQAQLDDAILQYERIKDGANAADIAVLEAQLANARREYDRVKNGPNSDDITVIETKIAASKASIDQAAITAPFDGTISSVEIQAGDQVDPGTLAFRLDDLSTLLVDLNVSEIDVNLVELGQDVVITFDAVLAKEYSGTIIDIALVGTQTLGITTFKVSVELHNPDTDVRPGMTSEVEIVTNRVDDVLLIPNRAIRLLDGERVVYVLREQSEGTAEVNGNSKGIAFSFGGQPPIIDFVPIPITLGASSDLHSEVLAGDISVGDEIVLNPELDSLAMKNRAGGISVEIHP